MRPLAENALGVALFLFVPLVLFLFVAHPEPIGASLAAGVVLMVGHRFLARPYMERVRERKCLWCNRFLSVDEPREQVAVAAGARELRFAVCPAHARPTHSFLGWVDRLRLPLRLGIALPLLALLGTLALAASGGEAPVAFATDLFRFVVGLTVNVAALGPFVGPHRSGDSSSHRAAFPPHNFSLLGVRAILWILRLVGLFWIVSAGAALAARLGG